MSTETTTRTTLQVANRLVELCRTGDFTTAINELYADSIVSIEPADAQAPERTEGFDNVLAKSQHWAESVKEVHGNKLSDPIVADKHFTVSFDMDVTFKEAGRMHMQELGVYEVRDGKIVHERFFYDTQGG